MIGSGRSGAARTGGVWIRRLYEAYCTPLEAVVVATVSTSIADGDTIKPSQPCWVEVTPCVYGVELRKGGTREWGEGRGKSGCVCLESLEWLVEHVW